MERDVKKEYTASIIRMEWELFDKVQNIGGRASCQDQWSTFQIMRSSQLLAWTPELLSSYQNDLLEAKAAGRNPLSEKYGYIIPADAGQVSAVSTFKEKPDAATAQKYIEQGALWNGGVFAYKLKYVLNKAHELIDFTDYQDLFQKYSVQHFFLWILFIRYPVHQGYVISISLIYCPV